MISTKLKTALVYDKVNTWGGAERVLLALHDIFPDAPLYTSVYNQQTAQWAKIFPNVTPSFLKNFPQAKTHNHLYCLLAATAFESFNFDKYDIVISVTSGEAKGIITKPHTLHISYCLTPTRYLWTDPGYNSYKHFNILNKPIHLFKAPFLTQLRIWDQIASSKPDHYLTISKTVQRRIKKYYHRDSKIISPPVETDFFKPPASKTPRRWNTLKNNNKNSSSKVDEKQNYYLVVSRLTGYKKVKLAIEACAQLNLPLKIAGDGPEYKQLKFQTTKIPNIQLLGKVTDLQLLKLYQNCTALIMPQEEDFGIVSLEAQACGKPVIAYKKGGATETIIEDKTGLFFSKQTTESLTEKLKSFNSKNIKSKDCRTNALKYSKQKFQTKFKKSVLKKYRQYKSEITNQK